MILVNNGQDIHVQIKANVAKTFSYVVENTSDKSLYLTLGKVSCSCTQLDISEFTLAPGEKKRVNGTVLRGTSALFTPNIMYGETQEGDKQMIFYNINIELT